MPPRGIPAQIKKLKADVSDLRKRVVDVEDIQHEELGRIKVHGRRISQLEESTMRHGRRLSRAQAAIERLRRRVEARYGVKQNTP